jgi:oxaloacetate decarboxylase (Na+ extruding) subunit alpha
VGGEFVSRFVASAAESGIEVFRLHDPLNDVENLREAGQAITDAGKEFDAGLVYGSGYTNETEALVEQARKLPDLGAARVLLHDPSSSLQPHRAQELVGTLAEASGLPVGLYCQGAGGNALASGLDAVRAGADLVACAVYPVALTVHRISGEAIAEALSGLGHDTGVDVDALWRASELVDEHIGDQPVTPLAPRIAVRAAEHKVPPGLVAALDGHLRALAAGDRLDEVLDELARIREEVGWPPIASPIGQIVGSQALLHVLSATRYQTVVDELRALIEGRYGSPPGPIDATVRRAVSLSGGAPEEEAPVDLESLRVEAKDLASSEEELLLLALFGEEAEPLLSTIRGRASGDDSLAASGVDQARAERIRELVRIVQESGVGEVTIEEAGMRVSVRRTPEPLEPRLAPAVENDGEQSLAPSEGAPAADGFVRVEAPMVGVFYRAPQPGAPPFVQEGDAVASGQTLCILEAMKLMNEIKADSPGVVRSIHVGNAEPVEFGQLLFELEPVGPPPLDAV